VTAIAPTAYTPGEHAVGGEGAAQYAKVAVTIKNGSARPFDPTVTHLTASSGGQQGDQAYDDKVASSPDTTVPPGKAIAWDGAFAAQSLDDLTIEGSPGGSPTATWCGRARPFPRPTRPRVVPDPRPGR
jgi:hypothetical protein